MYPDATSSKARSGCLLSWIEVLRRVEAVVLSDLMDFTLLDSGRGPRPPSDKKGSLRGLLSWMEILRSVEKVELVFVDFKL